MTFKMKSDVDEDDEGAMPRSITRRILNYILFDYVGRAIVRRRCGKVGNQKT